MRLLAPKSLRHGAGVADPDSRFTPMSRAPWVWWWCVLCVVWPMGAGLWAVRGGWAA